MIRVGSLFTGIGGLDLGIERVFGEPLAWNCEIDPFCLGVLQRRWPDVPNIGDVRAVDWQAVRDIDLLCAGFPCQPASVAGKRRGVEDERWLWGEVARALRVLRPRLALLENVPGLLTVDGGRAFGLVLADLAELGYVARWTCLRASDLGAPHRRNRLFVLADREQRGPGRLAELAPWNFANWPPPGREESADWTAECGASILPALAHSDGGRAAQPRGSGPGERRRAEHGGEELLQLVEHADGGGRRTQQGQFGRLRAAERDETILQTFPFGLSPLGQGSWAAGVVVRGYDATDRLVEPAIRPLADGLPGRVARLRALGNAVVPDQAEYAAALLKQVAQI